MTAAAPPLAGSPWAPAKLVSWLDGIEPAIERLTLFELLELPPTGSGEHVQIAYHQIARTRHPDLFRGRLSARDAERLMRVYGRIAAAYATLRHPDERSRYLYELRNAHHGRAAPTATAIPEHGGIADGTNPGLSAHDGGSGGAEPAPPREVADGTAPGRRMRMTGRARMRAPAVSENSSRAAARPRGTTAPPVSSEPRTRTGSTALGLGSSPRPGPPRPGTASRPGSPPPETSPATPPSTAPRGRLAPANAAPPRPSRSPTLPGSPPPPAVPAGSEPMSPRAQAFYRRAEVALAAGDLAGALLNLKMAVSADPTSTFLRGALADVQRRLK